METSREDVGIAIRSAFLRKGTQQRFSLFALVLFSIILIYIETIEEKEHLIRILGIREYESFSWTIPQDRFLVLGDNRDNSLDSRAWGYFSKENLIGKAEFIWLHWALFSEMPSFNRNKRIQ